MHNTAYWNRARNLERRSEEKQSEKDWEYYQNRSKAHKYTKFRDYVEMIRNGIIPRSTGKPKIKKPPSSGTSS